MKTASVQSYDFQKVYDQLDELVQLMITTEKKYTDLLLGVHPNFQSGATNLMHYLVLRSAEIREAQEYLELARVCNACYSSLQ